MSELRANTISDAAGTGPVTLTGQYAAKAWVNFDGTGTVSIRESENVGSITDNGTGDYTVKFTTAMPDANYCVSLGGSTSSHGSNNENISLHPSTAPSTTSFRLRNQIAEGDLIDPVTACASIFR